MKERPILFSAPMVRAILDGRKMQTRRLVGDLRVVPRSDVGSDMPSAVFGATGPMAREMDDAIENVCISAGHRYRADLNPHGAVFAELGESGRLGLKPGEFDFACPYADGHTYCDGGWRIDVAPEQRLWVRETWRTGIALDEHSPAKIAAMALEADYTKPWAPICYVADGATDNADTLRHSFGGAWGKTRNAMFMPRWASRLTLEVTAVRCERLQDITSEDATAEGGPPHDDVINGGGALAALSWFCSAWDHINGKRAPWSSNPWVWALTFRRVTP